MFKGKKLFSLTLCLILMSFLLTACSGNNDPADDESGNVQDDVDFSSTSPDDVSNPTEEEINSNNLKEEEMKDYFKDITLTTALKDYGFRNPLMTQRLGADPYALSYNGRVYMYMTADVVEYEADGVTSKNNSFSRINTLNVISSDDLANWTDHGAIKASGPRGAAPWGNNSWAPAAAHKKINGKDQFFIYFANGGNGIGVLTSDSPIGPFVDPLGRALISRSTPNCASVSWLFDPAVLVDDDGTGYLYFGGGIPNEQFANPGTGRAVQLADDMISLAGDPVKMETPYLFEDSGINKIGDTYYYSYCSNWNVDPQDAIKLGFNSAQIVYMTSKNPLGPFELQKPILKNPGVFFGAYGTNHHCMFEHEGQLYMAYHSQMLEKKMNVTGGYRSTNIDYVTVEADGSINNIMASEFGVKQLKGLNPFERVEAETMGTMAGISTTLIEETGKNSGTGNMAVTDINTGDWIALYGVDFGDKGANTFTVNAKAPTDNFGIIEIRLDKPNGEAVGHLKIDADNSGEFKDITANLYSTITGEHDLIFVFYGENYELDYWYFK